VTSLNGGDTVKSNALPAPKRTDLIAEAFEQGGCARVVRGKEGSAVRGAAGRRKVTGMPSR